MSDKPEKLRRKDRMMINKTKKIKKEKSEKIDHVWDLISDLNPY